MADTSSANPAWLEELDGTLKTSSPENEFPRTIARLIKEYLDSDDEKAGATFAQRVDNLYDDVYLPKFDGYNGKKKGWTGFLIAFYEILFGVGVRLPYDDARQDKLIQLLCELRKLPARSAKIFVVSTPPYMAPHPALLPKGALANWFMWFKSSNPSFPG